MDEKTLSLLHLKKTFSEYLKVPISGARNNDPSRLLPLFKKVMLMYTPQQLQSEFKEAVHFATFLCSVLVKEIRQRAASEGTSEAAQMIAEFLRPGQSEAKGWALLSSIQFLVSAEDEVMMDAACKVSLPSTLVKTVYLLFDLVVDETTLERNEQLNSMINSILSTMCKFKSVSEELVRKEDLVLLFVGATSNVQPGNECWRKTCSRLLEVISEKSLSHAVVRYIISKSCIKTYVRNLASIQKDTQYTAEAIICLFCVLKDSARYTDKLLDEFVLSNGYTEVKDFLLKCEHDEELVRNILLMAISLITSGTQDVLPMHTSGLVQLANFVLPMPAGNGLSVRNLNAFSLIYQIFLESNNEKVSCTVMDILHSIYTCDPANYFILDRDYPLAIFIDQMERKQDSVRLKLLELVELAVFQFAHIPCRELISICVLMKTEISSGGVSLSTMAVQSFFRLLTVDPIMKDAFREVGLLDALCYIDRKLFEVRKSRELTADEKKLALLASDLLTVAIKGNVENTNLFTDCLGPREFLKMVSDVDDEWKSSLLQLVKQLMLVSTTDQYTSSLVNTILSVVRESHKVRIQFRKTGGFLALAGLLLNLEAKFSTGQNQDILELIQLIFKVFSLSMRFEPSNAKYFSTDVTWESITSILRLTGIFNNETEVRDGEEEWRFGSTVLSNELAACQRVFAMDEAEFPEGMPQSVYNACYTIRLLFNMALDNFEKVTSDVKWTDGTIDESIVSWTSAILVHPGAVMSILSLLPSIHSDEVRWTVAAQYYTSLLLKALLKPERNQQLMCQVDMPRHLLCIAHRLFTSENHILLQPFYYLLERLSYQSLKPNQLRHFLRLDNPLCCRSLDEKATNVMDTEGGPVPLQRVRALVSMMTPRDQRIGTAPSFVEFDMSSEGFAALFLPSLAPPFSATKTERTFPPLNGFTYSTWLYLDSLSDKKVDAHPLRLLSLSRTASLSDEKKKGPAHLTCFQVQLSAIDRSLLISTEEHDQLGYDMEKTAKFQSDKFMRVRLADVIRSNEWFHVCLVFTRSVLKPSQISVYINGKHFESQKLTYIVQNAGGSATQLAHTHAVNAVIGTLPSSRRPSRLRYRIASTYLLEEPLSPELVKTIYNLQPHYIGNFQTCGPEFGSIVQEEKIIFSLCAAATQELTLAKVRMIYGKLDAEMLSQQLGISPGDNSTPLRVLVNTVAQAPGAGRTFGGVAVGYLSMRTFTPRPVPALIDAIGGFACLYGLIAMATDSEGLYASLKALVSALRSNPSLHDTLCNNRAYQILAVLLEDKAKMLNSHIMHMIFNVTGTADTSREHATIPHPIAFEDVLCDLDVWQNAPEDLHKMLFEHFYELITDHQRENLTTVRRASLLSRLLLSINEDAKLVRTTHDVVFNLVSAIVQPQCDARSILKLGQIIASTLPTTSAETSDEASLPFHISELQTLFLEQEFLSASVLHRVYVRNRLLNILANILSHSSPQLKQNMCDHLVRVLGFDWLMALMTPGVHPGTLYLALRLLLSILSHAHLLNKFRDGHSNGGWLQDADSVVRNRAAVVLGFSVSAHGGSVGSKIDINPELHNCAGFAVLEHVLGAHADKPYPYFAMLSILVRQPVKDLRFCDKLDMESVWTHVFGLSFNSSVFEAIHSADFCFEALIPLFSMVRTAIYHPNQTLQGWHLDHPSTTIQMLTFLYQNSAQFFSASHTEEFILAAFSCLIEDTNAMGMRSEAVERELGSPDAEYVRQILSQFNVKCVLELLKRIVTDNFQISNAKNWTIIDVIVDNMSEGGRTKKLQVSVLTALVHCVLEYVVSTDLLVSSSLPPSVAGATQSSQQIGANVFLFATRVVDGVWNGALAGDTMRLLNSLYHLHAIASRKENKVLNVEPLTTAIMKLTLYILSRPIDSVNVQLNVLDTLSLLITKRYIFLASNESWFFSALTHLIFMLSVTPDVLENTSSSLDASVAQVSVCACRVWTDVICTKKTLLEETFKRQTVTELNAARALLAHVAGVHWQQFVDSQINSTVTTSTTRDLQQQISSKITKVATGISRFAAKRSMSTTTATLGTVTPWKNASTDKQVIFMWLRVHISLVNELVRAQTTRYHEWHAHVRKWCLHDWHQWEAELTRERGIWGPERASELEKFKLDMTEGPNRVRRKLIPERNFYHLYPYRPHLDEPQAKAQRGKVAISHDSKKYYEACKQMRRLTMDTRIIDMATSVATPSSEQPAYTFSDLAQINASLIRRMSAAQPSIDNKSINEVLNEDETDEKEGSVDDPSSLSIDEETDVSQKSKEEETKREKEEKKRGPDNQTLLRLLEQGEQLHSMFRCARIQGLETAEGLLLFGRDHFYVIDGFTLLKTKEIRDLDFLSSELHDPIVPYPATGATQAPKASKMCSKFSYQLVREVLKRRYLLQPIALEVFSGDGRNYLLAFPKKIRDRVYDKLVSMAQNLTSGGSDSLGGQKANVSIEPTARVSILSSLIGQQSVTQRWLNGNITNFQYLMHLNTLAGRSYNDLSQYPVFPWVLADYTSPVLNLSNPKTFRDFSKPMGAQSEERLEQFLKRYREWDDPSGETPPYMFGTHYSSAMIVVSYLVRLEPFTQQFLSLQGGHFDLADRMFHSVGDAWTSASRNNMADVKELIPEFFTLPEMFENKNKFDLGVKQNGVQVDDVVLPPWANGDAREFIRLHRQALESDYVSSHLHEWIDLVFGYKQNGDEAIKANNLFHHLFYEGSVDFENIEDPLTRNATIGFVNNFGQIPSHLFKKPHPQKKVNVIEGYSNTRGVTTSKLFYHLVSSLKPPQAPMKELRSAVGSIHQTDKSGIFALEQNRVLLGYNRYVSWGLADRSLRIGLIDSDKSQCVYEMCETDEITCVASSDDSTLFCANTSGTITVWKVQNKPLTLKKQKVLDGHSDAVTCLVTCPAHALVVSASRDCSVILWHLSDLSLIRQLSPHPQPVAAVAINDSTGDIATGCATTVHIWTLNGQLLAVLNTCDSAPSIDPQQSISCLSFSTINEWDEDNVLMCGTTDGVVKIYSCIMTQNDGTLNSPHMQIESKPKGSTAVANRLERQRRRLKGAAESTDTLASSEYNSSTTSQSPEVPPSPKASASTNGVDSPKYVRLLVQRAALTTHTAFNRPDNIHPAPITAIAPTKDHKALLIGDGIGRLWCWQPGENGSRADHWVLDIARQRCDDCKHKFTLAERKHHCRNCGQIFCAKCSRFESHITRMNISRPVRVCHNCFLRLKSQSSN